ncbi:MAG: DUF1343 domain-containing protein [Bacteroidia bacterium]|nr:DUF1343 domain-containing protein [Bacteroidia bacterium]
MKSFEYTKLYVFATLLLCFSLNIAQAQVITGAQQLNKYLPELKNKRVGLVVNQTSVINETHLVDTLKKLKVKIVMIFAPEHGFRGNHSAGAKVSSGIDAQTGIKVVSLYGKSYKPSKADMQQLDVVLYDIQDVGVRFYTYISTLHYVMEACAENKKPLIVLDRPNPNGYYVDGPVLDMKYKSFVGMHPVPVVHGLTIGEYARMINGEKWLSDSLTCKLTVVKLIGYDHSMKYELKIKPSPNLPTPESIILYSSLCFFEGTNYSLGRGTNKPFECVGKPGNLVGDYTFTPKSIKGVAENPPHLNKQCRGFLLTNFAKNIFPNNPGINLGWMIELYQKDTAKSTFFNSFFIKLAGTEKLQQQIEAGKTEDEIKAGWQTDLDNYFSMRRKYLLYTDFTRIRYKSK